MQSLFLLLLLFCSAEGTRFYLNGTVTCETTEDEWCFTIVAIELDSFSPQDHIAAFTQCLPGNVTTATYELDGEQSDDGWFDRFFELGYRIMHTCEVYDSEFELVAVLQEVHVWKSFYYEEKKFDLNNNTVSHVKSLCDEEWYGCHVAKKFYFVLGVDFNVKRDGYKVIRLY